MTLTFILSSNLGQKPEKIGQSLKIFFPRTISGSFRVNSTWGKQVTISEMLEIFFVSTLVCFMKESQI
jgi:hypothetical protein